MAKKNGSAATAPETPVALREEPTTIRMRVGDIRPVPGLNPRRRFDKDELKELATSIRENGLIEPLVLHETGEPVKGLVAGERRWRAAMLLGPDTEVNCTIKRYTQQELIAICLIENLYRVDLSAVEEARGFQAALELDGMTQTKLAEVLGGKKGKRVSQSHISNRLRLLKLPDVILDLIDDGKLQPTIARDVLLPFTALADKYALSFFAAIADALNELAADAERDTDQEEVIRATALNMTRSLNPNGYGKDAPLFQKKTHDKKCDCGAPHLNFGGWESERARCWNIEWWEAEQKRARAARKKREERVGAKPAAGSTEMGGLPVLDGQQFHKRYGYEYDSNRKFEFVADQHGHFAREGVFDPTLLDRSSLIVVKDQWGSGLRLATTDAGAVKKARAAFQAAVKARIAEVKPVRIAQDVAAARTELPDSIALLLRTAIGLRNGNGLQLLAAELGFKGESRNWSEPPLSKLTDDQLITTLQVAALRCGRAGVHDRVSLIDDIVHDELAAEHIAALRALVPYAVGADVEEEEEEDIAFDDDENAIGGVLEEAEAAA